MVQMKQVEMGVSGGTVVSSCTLLFDVVDNANIDSWLAGWLAEGSGGDCEEEENSEVTHHVNNTRKIQGN